MSRDGVIFGGGGANGRFQARCLRILRDSYGFASFAYVGGVSTGALQSSGYRRGEVTGEGGVEFLERTWDNVTERDVFRRRSTVSTAWHLIRGGLAIYDHSPLRALLTKELGTEPLDAEVGYVRLDTGKYVPARATVGTVLSSCTIPGVFEPPYRNEVDGGVVDVCPLGMAMRVDPPLERIIIITCNNLDGLPEIGPIKNIIQLMLRVWEILYHEHQKNDLEGFFRINRILQQIRPDHPPILNEAGRPYRAGTLIHIQPPKPGLPGTLDFSAGAMEKRDQAADIAVPDAMRRAGL